MGKPRFLSIFQSILVLSIMVLVVSCGGGGGGGGSEGGGEEALSLTLNSPSGSVTINEGETVTFQATVSGGTAPYTFQWDFGGGATNSDVEDPGSITFSNEGSYNVTLTVTDNNGGSVSASVLVTVENIPDIDSTPPTVSIISPLNNATSVAINSTISVTFNENIDPSTISSTSFKLSTGGTPVAGTRGCSGSTVTFTPSSSLLNNTIYIAEITTSVRDLAGNALATNYSWSFTTVKSTTPSSGTGLQTNSPWPMLGHDNKHSGRSPYIGPQAANLKWEFEAEGPASGTPVIGADGTVYIGSQDFKVYALDGSTGNLKWSFTTGDKVIGSPAIGADGTIYVGSNDSIIYALNGATGDLKWSFTTGWAINSSPAIGTDGTIYVGSDHLYALDGATGNLTWEYSPAGGSSFQSPVIGSDGTIYVAGYVYGECVVALNSSTGTEKWTYKPVTNASGSSSSISLGSDGTIYSSGWTYIGGSTVSLAFFALDCETGNPKWIIPGQRMFHSPAIGNDGTVYVSGGGTNADLNAIDGSTGNVKWTVTVDTYQNRAPIIDADGTIYIGDNSKVYALDGATGNQKWVFTTGGWIANSFAIGSNGVLYVGSDKVYAIGD